MFWVVARRLQVRNGCILGNFKDFADRWLKEVFMYKVNFIQNIVLYYYITLKKRKKTFLDLQCEMHHSLWKGSIRDQYLYGWCFYSQFSLVSRNFIFINVRILAKYLNECVNKRKIYICFISGHSIFIICFVITKFTWNFDFYSSCRIRIIMS